MRLGPSRRDPHSGQGMSHHTVSERAESAREQARDGAGRFGVQPASESDPGALSDPDAGQRDALRLRLQAAHGPADVTDEDLSLLLRHAHGPNIETDPRFAEDTTDLTEMAAASEFDDGFEDRERIVGCVVPSVENWNIPCVGNSHLTTFDPDTGTGHVITRHPGSGPSIVSAPMDSSEFTVGAGTAGEARLNTARRFIEMASAQQAALENQTWANHLVRAAAQSAAATDMAHRDGEPPGHIRDDARRYAIAAAYPGLPPDEATDLHNAICDGDDTLPTDLDRARELSDRHVSEQGTAGSAPEQCHGVRGLLACRSRVDVRPHMQLAFPNVDPVRLERQTATLGQLSDDLNDLRGEELASKSKDLDDRIASLIAEQNRSNR